MKIRDRLGVSNGAELAVTTYSHLARGVKPLTPIRNERSRPLSPC